jgi:uncharacterized phage-associated protein
MKTDVTYCEECNEEVTYYVTVEKLTAKFKGKEYTYVGKTAHCDKCGSPVDVGSISDFNLSAFYDEYRRENNLISLADVKEIPKKYNIGKRPLSLLLGWGEITYSRYLEGYLPSKQYSEELIRILHDPLYYASLLESKKDNLKSETAYKKSKKAVDSLLTETSSSHSAISKAIQYLLYQCEDITPLALQKALYYIQGFYYAFYDQYLFSDDCQAWVHGPVYRSVYERYRHYCFDPIEHANAFDESSLTASELSIFESVAANVCCYSGKILEMITHKESPWITARNGLGLLEPSEAVINKEAIGEYFTAVKNKYEMVSPSDIHAYMQTMFTSL